MASLRASAKSIGFVPTMGALHKGHLSLIDASKSENDITVCSIFVNPTQFDNPEDLAHYPRTLETDQQMLEKQGCDILFAPPVNEMYTGTDSWKYDFGDLGRVFEGASRKGHFQGVGQIVQKLLELVKPDRVYFGQKDYQQYLIISKLIRDFNIPVILVCCPIIREGDGLAMSSRNKRLSAAERKQATGIYRVLSELKELSSSMPPNDLKQKGWELLGQNEGVNPEYLDIVNAENLLPVDHFDDASRIIALVAARVGPVRLIDNIFLKGNI